MIWLFKSDELKVDEYFIFDGSLTFLLFIIIVITILYNLIY